MSRNSILGIDIGGSHISACMVDMQRSCLLDHTSVRLKVDPEGNADDIIDAWAMAIEASFAQLSSGFGQLPNEDNIGALDANLIGASRDADVHRKGDWCIGIAMPGPFDYEKGVSLIKGLHKFESLYGLNIKNMLATRLGIPAENIRMVNDASAFLLGEVKGGAGKGYTRAAGVTLGTGVGSAGFFDDAIEDGDLWCTPFKDSRAEDYLCSRWFVQEYAAIQKRRRGQGAENIGDALPEERVETNMTSLITGVKDLVPMFDTDPDVRSLFTSFGQHLAEALMLKYPSQGQDVVIIGGNITKAWDLFIPATLAWWKERGVPMNIRPALLGEHAAVIGAAFLWR